MDHSYPNIALQGITGLVFVRPEEVLSAQADGNYTVVKLSNNREVKVLRQLKEIEALLTMDSFVRVHRSHLLNLEHVMRLEEETVLMTDGTSIPLARDRKTDFIEKFTRI